MNNDLVGPAICPICGREFDGQEVAVIEEKGNMAILETKCLACGKRYRFKADKGIYET